MRGKLADAKVGDNELQLGAHGQRGRPDVDRGAAPQLHGAARPAVLLLAVREEAGRQLSMHRCFTSAVQTTRLVATAPYCHYSACMSPLKDIAQLRCKALAAYHGLGAGSACLALASVPCARLQH